jgi:pSer/pThr/pTyr-binding forkhead associated (FHA) protein
MKVSVQIEPDRTLDLETKKNLILIGRSPECDLVVNHPSVSRKHCQIEEIENTLFIIDHNSSNGTFIDGLRLIPNEKQILRQGQKFTIGKLESKVLLTDPGQFTSSKINAPKIGSNTKTINVSHLGTGPTPGVENLSFQNVLKVKGPRNPIAEDYKLKRAPNNNSRNIYIILFGIVSVIVGMLMFIGLRK